MLLDCNETGLCLKVPQWFDPSCIKPSNKVLQDLVCKEGGTVRITGVVLVLVSKEMLILEDTESLTF